MQVYIRILIMEYQMVFRVGYCDPKVEQECLDHSNPARKTICVFVL